MTHFVDGDVWCGGIHISVHAANIQVGVQIAGKPQLVAANKIDALDDEQRPAALAARAKALGLPFYRISGVTGAGECESSTGGIKHRIDQSHVAPSRHFVEQ